MLNRIRTGLRNWLGIGLIEVCTDVLMEKCRNNLDHIDKLQATAESLNYKIRGIEDRCTNFAEWGQVIEKLQIDEVSHNQTTANRFDMLQDKIDALLNRQTQLKRQIDDLIKTYAADITKARQDFGGVKGQLTSAKGRITKCENRCMEFTSYVESQLNEMDLAIAEFKQTAKKKAVRS